MDVDVRKRGLHRDEQVAVLKRRHVGVDPALHADLGRAASDRVGQLGQDGLVGMVVGVRLPSLALEAAELASDEADVGEVDITVDDVGNFVADVFGTPGRAGGLIGRVARAVAVERLAVVGTGLVGTSVALAAALSGAAAVWGVTPARLRPSQLVEPDASLIVDEGPRYVSRGGTKLENALEALGIDVAGRDCLDVGASTGGFTDCLLQRGANRVAAVDVAADVEPEVALDGGGDIEDRLRAVCGHVNVLHAELVELAAEALETGVWAGHGVRSLSHWLSWQAGLSARHAAEITRLAEARVTHTKMGLGMKSPQRQDAEEADEGEEGEE